MFNFHKFPNNVFFDNSFFSYIKKYKKILIIHTSSFNAEDRLRFNNKSIFCVKFESHKKLFNHKIIKKIKFNLIIAVGGGEVIDNSKALYAKLCDNSFNLSISNPEFNKKGNIKFAVIVTMPGSGAEVSKTCVLNLKKKKHFFINRNFIPDYVFYDIKKISNLNKIQLGYRTIDSIMHTIESKESIISSKFSNIISDEILKTGIETLKKIQKIQKNYIGKEIAELIALLSFYGGFAQSEAGTGLCHALAHSLEENYKINHSEAIFLTSFVKIEYQKKTKTYDYYKQLLSCLKKFYSNTNINEQKRLGKFLLKINFKTVLESAKNDICWKLGKHRIDEGKLKDILKKFKERKTWII